MEKLNNLWIRYGTARSRKILFLVLTVIALAVAGGAPSGGGGGGSAMRVAQFFGF
jgi:hypothetical protein